MKFNLRQISYGYSMKNPDEKLRLLYALLKKYKLTLVENEIPFSPKIYLVRESDLWWLLNEDCVGRKAKLQAAMFTCGSLDHIYNWICDKDDQNSLVYKQE